MPEDQIVLIDSDAARREQIREMIEAAGMTVAVYESASQFDSQPRKAALFLIADERRLLQSMTVFLSRYREPHMIIAYRSEPAIHDVVEAMKLGAMDYLAWPFKPAALVQRLTALGRRTGEAQCGAHAGQNAFPPKRERRGASLLRRAARRAGGDREGKALTSLAQHLRGRFAAVPGAAPRPLVR